MCHLLRVYTHLLHQLITHFTLVHLFIYSFFPTYLSSIFIKVNLYLLSYCHFLIIIVYVKFVNELIDTFPQINNKAFVCLLIFKTGFSQENELVKTAITYFDTKQGKNPKTNNFAKDIKSFFEVYKQV